MSSNERTEDAAGTTPAARYYKSRDAQAGVIHVQYEDHWKNYGSSGAVIASGNGEFPAASLAVYEEVDEVEGVRLVEAARRLGAEEQPGQTPEAAASGPSGIGGWLIVPILGLFTTLLFALAWFVQDVPLLQDGVWADFPASLRSLIAFEAFVNLVLMVGSVALLVLLFMKKSILPRLMVVFYAFAFLAVLVDTVSILALAPQWIPDPVERASYGLAGWELGADVGRIFLACAVWIPYFLISKRVKNTFVNPMGISRRGLWWILGVCSAVALLAIGLLTWACADPERFAGAASGPSAGESPADITATETYTDPGYAFSFDYPADWQRDNKDLQEAYGVDYGVGFYDPYGDGDALYSYTTVAVGLHEWGAQTDESTLPEVKSILSEDYPESAFTNATVAGVEALVVTSSEDLDGTPTRIVTYYLCHEDLIYELDFQATEASWSENAEAFDLILESFKPGTGQ